MKGEAMFLAMGEIEDSFVLSVAEILESGIKQISHKKTLRVGLIAAVLVALLLAACAAGIYFEMYFSDKAEHSKEKLDELWMNYEDMSLVLGFDGPKECRMAGFKANYLPSEPDSNIIQQDMIWYKQIADESSDENGMSGPIPYNVSVGYVSSDYQMVFGGETEIIKDESKGSLRIVELEMDLSDTEHSRVGNVNYLLIFDAQNGYLITMFTTLHDMAELEKIAAGLEIHVYTETVTPRNRNDYSLIMPGRG